MVDFPKCQEVVLSLSLQKLLSFKENIDKDFLKLLDKHFCEYDETLRKLSNL